MVDMSWGVALLLVISGLLVGFINTIAAGASIISLTTFTALGLPISAANGTNRIPAFFQNLVASLNFIRSGALDLKLGLKLAIPTILGNIVGSELAVELGDWVFKLALGAILTAILILMVSSSDRRLKGDGAGELRIRPIHYLWFFLIGIYCGYIYVAMGYLILAVSIGSMKMDIVSANALKSFVALASAPFALAVFMFNDQVFWTFGLVHSIGNIIGAYVASRHAVGWGVRFLRLFMIAIILTCMADMFELISIRDIILSSLGR